ncbi:hybrid sensor histidine kinase/response regulator [Rhodoferax sp.]|uniref:ATP-binding response regulator n=1 Tax=Rhodoferax sp. TaxID=50421 RepID=UPI00261E2278|nr:hybrid sensor histidine kinase/response regulator [Rhodoferax sp.]MDD2924455.1 hybrid sensor histidine kinase/response regulator [Rhodoferax sp.]
MSRDEAVRLEQARNLHDGSPLVLWGNFGGALCAFVIVFLGLGALQLFLSVWLLLFVGNMAWTFGLRRRYPRASLGDPRLMRQWFHWNVIGNILLGLLWGVMSAVVISAGVPTYQFAMLAGMAILTVGGMFSLGAYFPSFRGFFLVLMTLTIAALMGQGTMLHGGMGVATFLYLLFMLWSGQRFNRSYIDSLLLRFQNLDLVRELTLQKEAAENANLAKSRFLAAASHDLRQPMHALNLYHGAMENVELSSEAQLLLSYARQCAVAMDDMFSVLLDMSRLDAGAVTPNLTIFPVSQLLERIRVEFEPPAREKGLDLRVVKSSRFIRTDPALAERIVRNLVSNAVRYTHQGKILVACRRRGQLLRLAVFDTGTGIPQDKQQAVFEEYFQLSNPERDRTKGLGLGLAIVNRVSNLLGAPIHLQSEPGRGSMFAVDFECEDTFEHAPEPADKPEVGAGSLVGRLIVVIDDEAAIRAAIGMLLRQWGCVVVTAATGDDAVEQLAAYPTPPDVLVCDYRLRGTENGLDAIDKVRMEFCVDVPALLVTGDTAPDRILEIREGGFPVLHKPLQPDELRAALQRVMSGCQTALV